ncbi:single-stranded-DNA-specific exonuclease RecJ [Patescibacteria group bacterium]|nr:single-stranded-DNA-specific exonuclease RecJ [Patescibacteria group bacterium]
MKKWNVQKEFRNSASRQDEPNLKFNTDSLIKILLENRGIKTKKDIDEFLNPKLENVTVSSVGIDKTQLKKAIGRIKKAIAGNEQIIVFGDYDVDGICGTAIVWETLDEMGAKVIPYIPHRIDEGYGLSIRGIENLKSQSAKGGSNPKLVITVDNGIVANEAVEFANEQGIDVIVTDHHVPPAGGSKKLPKAYATVHTTKLCGTGVAYLLSQEIVAEVAHKNFRVRSTGISSSLNRNTDGVKAHSENFVGSPLKHLELVVLATIADLVSLTGANRTLVKFGIEELRRTERIGLLAIIKEAGIDQKLINTYEIGHIIAPRLNAMGRIEYAMESLRLLCTKDEERAKNLAQKLGETNRRRQEITSVAFEHAKSTIINQGSATNKLIFLAHESYQQGVVGLVAGKLVEEFYRPAIVVSKGEKISRASARSVSGFNIIEFIRNASEFLLDAGGHPMAAGFTIETAKLSLLQGKLEELAEELLDEDKLKRNLRIDCNLPLSYIDEKLYDATQKLAPFGVGNPQPTFVSRKVVIEDMRLVGMDGKHLKLNLKSQISNLKFDAIAFGMGNRSDELHIGDIIDIVFTIEQDRWNGNHRIQIKIKDLIKP